MSIENFEKTLWVYKVIDDTELCNKCDEIVLSLFSKGKFELNLNKFFSKFDIDLDTFLDEEKSKKEEFKLTDDVYQSGINILYNKFLYNVFRLSS